MDVELKVSVLGPLQLQQLLNITIHKLSSESFEPVPGKFLGIIGQDPSDS
jgi:hypothetical protein